MADIGRHYHHESLERRCCVLVFSVATAGLRVHSHQNRCQRNVVDEVL